MRNEQDLALLSNIKRYMIIGYTHTAYLINAHKYFNSAYIYRLKECVCEYALL